MRRAVPATHDVAVVTASSTAVKALVRILKQVRLAIATYDKQIQILARNHPEFALFNSLPGAGPVLVPRLIAALGTQRDRYQSAHEIQCYSGVAPVVARSGQQRWVHWRWSCPSSCGRPSTSGPYIQLANLSGRDNTTTKNAPKANRTIALSVPWPSNGFAFCFAVGKTAHPMTSSFINEHSLNANLKLRSFQ